MWLRGSCHLPVLVLWGLVHSGPLTDPHPDITDQELFWGADQYDFSVVLRAEDLNCFWHFAHRGENFYLNFMVRTKEGLEHMSTFNTTHMTSNRTPGVKLKTGMFRTNSCEMFLLPFSASRTFQYK